jgi:alpha,alpha-trehalase
MSEWLLIYDGFKPEEEPLREALCTLGNGYFATRGAAAESSADGTHYPGTYLAGGYNRLETSIADRLIENEDLVNLPNWLPLTFRINGGNWFNLTEVDILDYRQELDLKRGLLYRSLRFCDKEGRETSMINRRLVHMGNPHLAALETTLTPENWEGQVEICSALDGLVVNAGVDRYKKLNNKHLEPLETRILGEAGIYLKVRMNQSRVDVALAARTRVFEKSKELSHTREATEKPGYVAQTFTLNAERGKRLTIEKVISLFTSRDHAICECGLEARKTISEADSFAGLLESHETAWKHLWENFEIDFQNEKQEGNRTQMILRLYVFHLLQTTSMHTMDLDVGVPSRGWHGEAYRGHIFWDELFIFPLLNLRIPEITRALLKYRYRRLPEARRAARQAGFSGALFPWQSGSNGREESQIMHLNPKSGRWIPDNSHLQRHVNAAIVYNLWHYYQATGDMEFLSFYGAELIFEIARFWSSIITYNQKLDRYEILGVMGPDEYHDSYPDADKPGLNNNAYTNIMVVWVLSRALEICNLLPQCRCDQLCEKLEISHKELEYWRDISRKMRIVFHGDGIISQFEGYDQLEEFDWEVYRKKYGDIQRLDRILEAEDDTPNRYKVSKQADALMLFYLFSAERLKVLFDQLNYPFFQDTIPKNINYYLQRTSHGSTLSRVVHSRVLARLDRVRSWKLFAEALESDVSDIQGGTTPEGIHLGAMAGVVDIIQRGYTEIEPRGDMLWMNPCLPEELTKLNLRLRYRGHALQLEVTRDRAKIETIRSGAIPIKIGYQEEIYDLREGEIREINL